MDYTQNSKIEQVKESTLVIGIDIGSETHYARAFDWRGRELTKKVFCFSSDIEGFSAFYEWSKPDQQQNRQDRHNDRLRAYRTLLVYSRGFFKKEWSETGLCQPGERKTRKGA